MKVDLLLMNPELSDIAAVARRAESLGYTGLVCAEIGHDAFLPLALAAEHTERIQLATGIAVGLSRSPVHLAHAGHDLQRFSQGRFILGVGSQVQAHIEKRYSAVWSHPTERMRELIGAVRAVWRAWDEREPLRFEGRFYRHTLMTPFFSPPPNPHGPPPIFLAAAGPEMTAVAGEVADGVMLHALTSVDHMAAVTVPALERGLATAGRSRSEVEMYGPVFVITGDTDAALEAADRSVRTQLAFYASTPAYRGVLEFHDRAHLPGALNELSKQGRWREMGDLVDDGLVELFSVTGKPEEIAGLVTDRFGTMLDRVALYAPYRDDTSDDDAALWARVLAGFSG